MFSSKENVGLLTNNTLTKGGRLIRRIITNGQIQNDSDSESEPSQCLLLPLPLSLPLDFPSEDFLLSCRLWLCRLCRYEQVARVLKDVGNHEEVQQVLEVKKNQRKESLSLLVLRQSHGLCSSSVSLSSCLLLP